MRDAEELCDSGYVLMQGSKERHLSDMAQCTQAAEERLVRDSVELTEEAKDRYVRIVFNEHRLPEKGTFDLSLRLSAILLGFFFSKKDCQPT